MNEVALYQTAIHEAGHAVIAVALGKKFRNVSIRAEDDYLGRIKYWVNKKTLIKRVQGLDSQFLNQSTIEKHVKLDIIISYAGYTAQLKTGVDDPDGAASDFEWIINIGLTHAGGDADSFIAQCFEDTKEMVEKNWTFILIVAQQLLEKKTISGKAVIKIMKANDNKILPMN